MSASVESGGTDIGRRVREQRERVGLSREEAAERAGLAAGYLSYLEASPDSAPAQATLVRLAGALGTSVGALCGARAGRAAWSARCGGASGAVEPDRGRMPGAHRRGGVGRVLFAEPARGPVAMPVNFRTDGDDVVFRTRAGTRLADWLGHAALSFDVDHLDEARGEGWSVLVTGTASVITNPGELRRAQSLGIEPWAGGDRQTYVRLRVSEVTGRAIRVTT